MVADKNMARDGGRGGGREKGETSLLGQVTGLRKGSASSFALNGERRDSMVAAQAKHVALRKGI